VGGNEFEKNIGTDLPANGKVVFNFVVANKVAQ
jgi:hypothetical protein